MDRTGKIAVGIAIAVLLGWMYWNNQEITKTAARQAEVKAAVAEAAAQEKAAEPVSTIAAAEAPAPRVPTEPAAVEKRESISSPLAEYTFSNLGGGIATAMLRNFTSEGDHPMVLNEFGSIPIGAVTEAAGEGMRAPFEMKVEGDSVTFERTDARQVQMSKKFTVTKSTEPKEKYLVTLDVTFTNRGAEPVTLPGYFVYTGAAAPVHQKDRADYTGFMEAGGKFIAANYFDSGMFHPVRPVFTVARQGIAWAGVADQYFTTLVTPQAADAAAPRGSSAWATRFTIEDSAWTAAGHSSNGSAQTHYGVDGAIGMPALTLESGKAFTQSFRIFAGPREYNLLRLMPEDQSDIMNFGIFGLVSKTLLNSMNRLHSILGSYALAIIVLTLFIKTLLWPMQNKSTQSMKRMQLLQPKMTELREKYKDDPTRMNTEVMKLYKDYGVNPMSGCLPMLVQIPIFFGFFTMLGTAVELRGSKFLWVPDLSLPDTIWHLPGVGWPVNILPIVMALTMLWQMSLSPKSGDPMQQKIFMFMPLIFIAFCYNYASALALYWTVQNLFSVAQLYATRNQAPPTLQKKPAPPKRK